MNGLSPLPHAHRCPDCYEATECHYAFCAIEWGLRLDDGRECGAFVVCSDCTGCDPREPLGPKSHTIAGGW